MQTNAGRVNEYLDTLVNRGNATLGAIAPLKTAFTKVMQTVEGDGWENTDVKEIDVDDYVARFTNLTMGRYSNDSLVTYKSRMKKVVRWYLESSSSPSSTPKLYVSNHLSKVTVKPGSARKPKIVKAVSKPSASNVEAVQSMPVVAGAANRILYPYPLLDGQIVHVSLPARLTKRDARRIGAFIESIAIDLIDEVEV